MMIGPFDLDSRVLIVAEIGNNHEGDVAVALEMIGRAAECGVGAVKFQTLRASRFVRPSDRARFDQLRRFELPDEAWPRLARAARTNGLLFLSTPLDLPGVEMLEPLVDAFKIASGDNDFYPLMDRLCETGKPIVMSGGLADLAQIKRSKQHIEAQWSRNGLAPALAVLHCVSSYPTPAAEANLAAISSLRAELDCAVGYSDHTLGIEACTTAAALGAAIIEKHFTLDKQYSSFRDHALSADPAEMRQLVQQIETTRVLLGRPEKTLQPSEKAAVDPIRRSIVAAADLAVGHQLAHTDLTWMRPGTGLRPGEEAQLVGRRLGRAVVSGEQITLADLD